MKSGHAVGASAIDGGVDGFDAGAIAPFIVHQSRPHAWFEAFAPYDKPKIVMVALVEHSGEGAQFAVPAVRETLQWYFSQGAGAKH